MRSEKNDEGINPLEMAVSAVLHQLKYGEASDGDLDDIKRCAKYLEAALKSNKKMVRMRICPIPQRDEIIAAAIGALGVLEEYAASRAFAPSFVEELFVRETESIKELHRALRNVGVKVASRT